jgi:hypothetical protein
VLPHELLRCLPFNANEVGVRTAGRRAISTDKQHGVTQMDQFTPVIREELRLNGAFFPLCIEVTT